MATVLAAQLLLAVSGCKSRPFYSTRDTAVGAGLASVAESGFYSTCSSETAKGHPGPWIGPLRKTRAQAAGEASQHVREFPNHRPVVLQY
jgi:hypothetical protein